MARLRYRFLLAFLLALVFSGSAEPFSLRQDDVSLAFQDLGPVLTAAQVGLPAGQGLANPSAVVLPDGRIRVYYGVEPPGSPGVYSAVSADGVHFTPEPGQRWFSQSGDVERLPDGRWRLYYAHGDGSGVQDGVASAISTDGLTFADEPGLRVGNPVPGGRVLLRPGIVRLAEGRYRMYLSARLASRPVPPPPFQIYSATSSDLYTWTLDAGVRQTGGSAPAALLNPDGSVMLVFNAELRLGTGPPAYISTATALDGLTFSPKVPTSLGGAAPSFVTLPDGRLLMYREDGDPAAIYAAVVTRIGPPLVSYPAQAVTTVTATSAHVSAFVDPQGADTDARFEYGTSTDYSDSTDEVSVPAANGRTTVSATLTGLSPATTYHFRVNAVNTPGETNGADQTFTTAARACQLGPERDHGWEIALAHARSRTGALTVLRHAQKLAGSRANLERDGCTDYEPGIIGLKSKRAAQALLRRAKSAGFAGASIERS